MSDIVAWISTNWVEITVTFTAGVYLFEKIAALTPTTWDDGVVGFLRNVVNWLALQKKA